MFEIIAYAETAAETVADTTSATTSTASLVTQFAAFGVIIILLYFMMIRPQRKREKETKAMISALKVGDKVVTIGGIMGKVIRLKDDYVIMETGSTGNPNEKSFIKMERSSIRSVEQKEKA